MWYTLALIERKHASIAQALVISQLSESHRQVLVPARETSPLCVASITSDTLLKLVGGQVVHELSKYGLAGIHSSLSVSGTEPAAKLVENNIRKSFVSPEDYLKLLTHMPEHIKPTVRVRECPTFR